MRILRQIICSVRGFKLAGLPVIAQTSQVTEGAESAQLATVRNGFASQATELEKHGWQFIDSSGKAISVKNLIQMEGSSSPTLKIAAPSKTSHFALSFALKVLSSTSPVYVVSLWQGQNYEQN